MALPRSKSLLEIYVFLKGVKNSLKYLLACMVLQKFYKSLFHSMHKKIVVNCCQGFIFWFKFVVPKIINFSSLLHN